MVFLGSPYSVPHGQWYFKTTTIPTSSFLVLLLLLMMVEYVSLITCNGMNLTGIFLNRAVVLNTEFEPLDFGKTYLKPKCQS